MVLSDQDYLRQMQALLPSGPAWPRDDNATLTQLLSGIASEFARVDGRAWQLLEEADPSTTGEMFLDWERMAGLPDACAIAFGGEQSDGQRRSALVGRITSLGGQSPAYFVALALTLGYEIEVSEYHEESVNDDVSHPLCGVVWNYVWKITTMSQRIVYFDVMLSADTPLASWGSSLLTCVIERLKPAHTRIIWSAFPFESHLGVDFFLGGSFLAS